MIFINFFRNLMLFKWVFCFAIFSLYVCSLNAQTKIFHKGDVTGLPLPRYVSIKSNKVNVRRGPNSTYQVDWVYARAGTPVKITAEHGNWRRVEDFQDEGGWIHARLLSGKRFVIFLDNKIILKRKPNKKSFGVAIVEKGVIARLVSTRGKWSEIAVEGHSGWVLNKSVWGAE